MTYSQYFAIFAPYTLYTIGPLVTNTGCCKTRRSYVDSGAACHALDGLCHGRVCITYHLQSIRGLFLCRVWLITRVR